MLHFNPHYTGSSIRDLDRYPWLPIMIVKGCYIDALRRARSSRELKRRGKGGRDRPGIRSIKITYSDSQDWRLREFCRVENI